MEIPKRMIGRRNVQLFLTLDDCCEKMDFFSMEFKVKSVETGYGNIFNLHMTPWLLTHSTAQKASRPASEFYSFIFGKIPKVAIIPKNSDLTSFDYFEEILNVLAATEHY